MMMILIMMFEEWKALLSSPCRYNFECLKVEMSHLQKTQDN